MVEKTSLRVMVIDDDPFMLKLLGRMLADQGISQLTTYGSGAAALASLSSSHLQPHLILLDLNMPEMDGIEFVRHLVERSYFGSLLLISGEDERTLLATEKLVQAHRISTLGHVQKPIRPEVISGLIAKWKPVFLVHAQANTRVYSAEEVHAAIINRELVNYYQPKVAVSTGHVVGVETLVRWNHPRDGLVLPDQFIGVAEAGGLIDDLTRIVLANALSDAKAWRNAGRMLQISVNVSMDNLKSLGFADFVAAESAAAAMAPQQLVLEVTESRLMQDARTPLEILTRLRLKRFKLSIDDFGTGHSSLAQLRDIPFDELKIDRGFVHRAWADETVRAIYEASLALAKQLRMDVVAEGVEDRDDWDFLCKTGCDFVQGYYIAKPMPASQLLAWMETWRVNQGQIAATRC